MVIGPVGGHRYLSAVPAGDRRVVGGAEAGRKMGRFGGVALRKTRQRNHEQIPASENRRGGGLCRRYLPQCPPDATEPRGPGHGCHLAK